MREALQKGRLGISALSPRITTGKEQWQEWHHDFFHNQMQDFIQDDVKLHASADEMNTDLEVITLREASQTALEVRPSTAVRVLQGFTELHAEATQLNTNVGVIALHEAGQTASHPCRSLLYHCTHVFRQSPVLALFKGPSTENEFCRRQLTCLS